MKKTVKIIAIIMASIVALLYTFNYDYLFSGIRKTYFRGKTSATIDDGKLFPSNEIRAGIAQPWEKAEDYNKTPLSKSLNEDLVKTNSASFLVIKNGKLLHEQYWGGNQKTRTNSFSMAKAVTVMLLGKAIEDGKVESLNQKYSTFYSNYANVPFGKNLTLYDLAAMEAGLDWKEDYENPFSPNARAYYGKSLAKAVFYKGFKEEPGKKFEYQSGSTQLLGFALRKAVNLPLATYLSQNFWQPLGMEQDAFWNTDENGMEKTFCCINAESRDFAKLGQLLLNDGFWDGKQLLNKDFVEKMRTPTKASNMVYGLGLWTNVDNALKYYYFRGMAGQFIIIIPEKNMVIVKTGNFQKQPLDSKGRPQQADFIVKETLKIYP